MTWWDYLFLLYIKKHLHFKCSICAEILEKTKLLKRSEHINNPNEVLICFTILFKRTSNMHLVQDKCPMWFLFFNTEFLMILQEVTLQPIDSLFFCWYCCPVLLALTTGFLATFLSQNLAIPNCLALRHFKHASQDFLYTSCHATELLETAVSMQ